MRQREQVLDQAVDTELADRAVAGDQSAFEELYRRHVEAAWRMALAVTSNPHDAADAVSDAFARVFQSLPERTYGPSRFRSYLLAAVRNAAIDGVRRWGRQRATDPGDHPDGPSGATGPADRVEAGVEAGMVASAFRSLPERWRSVLWLTEVEDIPAREVAGLLGLSPNGVAQLAVRARAGLRQRYLQAHVCRGAVAPACGDTVDRLGAYAAGGLAPRDIAKVDQHLAGCEACRARLAQLHDVAPVLRRSVLPLPAVLAAAAVARWRASVGGAAATGAAAPAAFVGAGVVGSVVPVPFAASVVSAVVVVAGLVGVGVGHRPHRDAAPPPLSAPAPSAAVAAAGGGAPSAPPPSARLPEPVVTVGGAVDRAAGAVAALDPATALVAGVAVDLPRLPTSVSGTLPTLAPPVVPLDPTTAVDVARGAVTCAAGQPLEAADTCVADVPGTDAAGEAAATVERAAAVATAVPGDLPAPTRTGAVPALRSSAATDESP